MHPLFPSHATTNTYVLVSKPCLYVIEASQAGKDPSIQSLGQAGVCIQKLREVHISIVPQGLPGLQCAAVHLLVDHVHGTTRQSGQALAIWLQLGCHLTASRQTIELP